jgi:RNA recognition motif-containing protein
VLSYFLFLFSLFNFCIVINIFVARLNFDTDSDGLRAAFEAYGEVDSAKVINDHFTGKSRGFGFVEMPNDDEAYKAIEALNESEIDGNTVAVKKAEPREKRGGGGGGGRDRGGYGGGGGRDRGGYGGGGDRGGYGGGRDRGGYGGGGDRGGDRGGYGGGRDRSYSDRGGDRDRGGYGGGRDRRSRDNDDNRGGGDRY